MKLDYIMGLAKSGKTNFCIEETLDMQEKGINSIIIVPEQSTLQVESKIIEKAKFNSIVNVQVYSFQRLAHKVFTETGMDNKVYIEDIGKIMLIRQILDKNKKNLKFYNKGYNKNGFIEAITKTLGELTQYNVSINELDKIINEKKINKSLQLKLEDLKLIFSEYNNYIKDKYISTSETLDILAEKIEASEYIKSANIFVDGFSGLTSQEYKVISKLVMNAESVTITFQIKDNDKIYSKLDPYFEPKKMKNNITEIVNSHGFKINSERFLKRESLSNKELDFLRENYFIKNKNYNEKVDSIKLYEFKNKYEEIEGIANTIIKLTKEEGYKYSDISMVVGNIDKYESIISGVFKNYDIPVFIDKKRDVMNNSLTEIIRGIIQVFVYNYSYESIFKVLKNELCTISMEEVEIFENYILEYGISGYRWNMETWSYGIKNSNYNLEEIAFIKDEVKTIFGYFTDGLKRNEEYSIEFLVRKIINFLIENEVYEKILQLEKIASDNNNRREEKEYNQIWDKYMTLFEKIVEVLGEQKVTVKVFGGILESGIKGLSLGMVPTYQNQVILGDIRRSKFPEAKVVFVVGANDGEIPYFSKENNILCDNDKEILAKEGITLSSTMHDFSLSQNLEIYNILVAGSDQIFITFPRATIDGSKLKISPIVYKLKNIFTQLEITEPESIITSGKPMLNTLVDILIKENNNEPISENEYIILEFFNEGENKEFVEKIKKIIANKGQDEILSQSIIEKIYGKEIITSISKLERYANCPYAYFVEYNLKAQERKLYEVGAIDLGNLFHEILDRFSKAIEKDNLKWEDLEEEDINIIVDRIVEELENEEGSIYKSSSRYNHYLVRATEICKKSIFALGMQLKSGDFQVVGSEVDFGIKNKISTIIVDIGEKRFLKLTGKVDRVDVMDSNGKRYVKIIDYKSGTKKFDEQEVHDGVQLQLLSYLNAILENGSKILNDKMIYEYLPGGVFYFNIQNPKFETEEVENNDYKKALLSKFKLSGVMTANNEVIKSMDKNITVVEDNLVGGSDIIPVYFKKDGTLSTSRSSALEDNDFKNLLDITKKNVERIGRDIFNGKIPVKPLENNKISACTYCKFSSICEIELLKND